MIRRKIDWRRWFREPLVHFVLLGSGAFGLYALVDSPSVEPLTGDGAPIEELTRDFQARTGAPPTDAERAHLVRRWLEEEALYRRALELGLDRSDTVVRRRLIQRMRFLVEDTTPVVEPDDAELRAWVAAHAADYEEPVRLTFEHLFFSRGKRGSNIARDAQAAARQLTKTPEVSVDADPFPRGALLREQTPASIARSFGAAFADRLTGLPVGGWHGPIESSYGLHLARVTSRTEAAMPSFEAIRERVRADWVYAERHRLNREAVDRLIRGYAVSGDPLR